MAPHFLRFHKMGSYRKCIHCDRQAMAYRLEEDGSKSYLCEDHLPTDPEKIEDGQRPKLRLVPPKTD